jgi:hypothetical protein
MIGKASCSLEPDIKNDEVTLGFEIMTSHGLRGRNGSLQVE